MKKFDEPPQREEPVQVIYLSEISNRIEKWKSLLPRVKPFYAIKSNPDNKILEATLQHNIGYDCASKKEIKTMLDMGITADRIIYANPFKQPDFIEYSIENGVYRMTLDSVYELEKIAKIDKEKKSKLVLRLKVDSGESSIISFSEKFGATREVALGVLIRAKELGLDFIGVSFHVGSMCHNPNIFETSIRFCREIFDMAKTFGFDMNFLDLGGGFTGKTFEECAKVINQSIEKYSFEDTEVIAEPGRFLCESSIDIYCRIIGKSLKNNKFHYILNDGVYNSFVSVIYDARKPLPEIIKPFEEETYPSVLWGNTCDSLDCLGKNFHLQELEIGDWLVFREFGAYGQPCEGFNGFELTEKIYLDHEYKRHS